MLYTTVKFLAVTATVSAGASSTPTGSTCSSIKAAYQSSSCCSSNLAQKTTYDIEAMSTSQTVMATHGTGMNICEGKKPTGPSWDNWNCTLNSVIQATEQSGVNVTEGYQGSMDVDHTPLLNYMSSGLCPVNVHWHLGAEHYSVGQYDEFGSSPSYNSGGTSSTGSGQYRRRELAAVRQGFQCHHYNSLDPKFTTPYEWKYCTDTKVGETYEVHWPHSAAGMCGTPNQYQTPFYDGVFCNTAAVNMVLAGTIATYNAIGVQGQVFTIVNDETYYYPDLMRGMIIEGEYGKDMAKYTGSTTGTSRDNTICSRYAPITWHMDRKCHLISASSFDKMCKDMLTQRDDMSGDIHPHGARTLVADELAADNHVTG